MSQTLGQRIAELRKKEGLTQEELAEKLGVSPQAVSKWENDISCPDIMSIPKIAKILGVSADTLLSGETAVPVSYVPEEKRKNIDDMFMRFVLTVNDRDDGDHVKMQFNFPMSLVKTALEANMLSSLVNIGNNEKMNHVDIDKIVSKVVELAEKGLMGKIFELNAGGDEDGKVCMEFFVE